MLGRSVNRLLFMLLLIACPAWAEESPSDWCKKSLSELPGVYNKEGLASLCPSVKELPRCRSVEKRPIFHADYDTRASGSKKILVFGLVHGDEMESGSIARRWMLRLGELSSRNSWRIVPVANPDGWLRKQRVNARGIDLNRNFPSGDWDELAVKYWREKKDADPRRNPGVSAGSEPETVCMMDHIDDYKPDFIVAVHTPYGILDFDGPDDLNLPQFRPLPWTRLGTFPGSLGRYMWKDKGVPVLTVELKDDGILDHAAQVDQLQDVSGSVAQQVGRKETVAR